jgi:uncharacterized membrane protein
VVAKSPGRLTQKWCNRDIATIRTVVTRLVEMVLALVGLAYAFLSSEDSVVQAQFLALWGLLAILYLIVGGRRVRAQRNRDVPIVREGRGWDRALVGRRFSFFFTIAASLTGLGAALEVISDRPDDEYRGLVTGLGATVIVCAWMLLHVGYARFYAHLEGLGFPDTPDPQLIDYLYFSFTVGVSFAASDVVVRTRPLRWHVMVHGVTSFLYNAAVLATAVSILTGR